MKKESFMIGTKFYRHIGNTEVPDIIRLKRQESDVLYFNNGGYEATVTNNEFKEMVKSKELIEDTTKFYYRIFKYFDNEIKQRWIMINNPEDNFIKFKIENIGMKMSIEELKRNYIKLIPDGFFTIANVTYPINDGKDTGFDVMCTMHKMTNNIPDIVCRQDTIDVFRFNNDSRYINIGISMPRSACPSNMDYTTFMYATDVKNFKVSAVYLDDSINTILKYIGPINKYNATIKKLKEKYAGTAMIGCKDNIYQLLTETGFAADFKELFGVKSFPFSLDLSRSVMNSRETTLINSILNHGGNKTMSNIVYCPYDKGIDLSRLDSEYAIIETGSLEFSNTFIVTYDYE